MDYMTVAECAQKWGLSERSVRKYCEEQRIPGAYMENNVWLLPANAQKPARKTRKSLPTSALIQRLKEEKAVNLRGGIYHRLQVSMAYNSNHIEGSYLTEEQTRHIFETSTIGISENAVKIDDIVETVNHFQCVRYLLDTLDLQLSEKIIKAFHRILKTGTADAQLSWFAVGNYKRLPNEVGMQATTSPEDVHEEMMRLLSRYNNVPVKTLDDLLDFHVRFEQIHPFQDGNGRVGRLILLRECLRQGIIPFVIFDDMKLYYYRGIREWGKEKGFLRDTCLSAQDSFKQWMDYFRIK